MNKIIALIILFSSVAHASMDMTDFPNEIPSREVVYDLAPPAGFKKLKVTFSMSGTVDNEISSIEIDVGSAIHSIKSSRLNINSAPNMNEINFHRIGGRMAVTPIYFNIFYGVPQKVECGLEGLVYLQKSVKVSIYPAAEPEVEKDNSFFASCKRASELEGSAEK